MKEYFNAEEKSQHLILCCCQEVANKFSHSSALTEEEQNLLKKIYDTCKELNSSIFNRLGDSYCRKVVNTMKSNKLRLVGKYEAVQEAISCCATEDIKPNIESLQCFNCFGCKKEKFTDCAIYNMSIACDIDGQNENGCPYSFGDEKYDNI